MYLRTVGLVFLLGLVLPSCARCVVRNCSRVEEATELWPKIYEAWCVRGTKERLELHTGGEYRYEYTTLNFWSVSRGTYERDGQLIYLTPENPAGTSLASEPVRVTDSNSLLMPSGCELFSIDLATDRHRKEKIRRLFEAD